MKTFAALLASATVIATASLPGAAQPSGPRTVSSRPDFQGTYEFVTHTPLQRPKEFEGKPFISEAEAAAYVKARSERSADQRSTNPQADLLGAYNEFWYERASDMLRVDGKYLTSRIIDPPDGRIPALTPGAQQRVAAAAKRNGLNNPEDLGLSARCMSPSPVISPGGEANLLQIVQTPDDLLIHTELMSVVRTVSLTRTRHAAPSMRSRTGDSIARWSGQTLVVDTTNYVGDFGFDYAAVDDNLHVTERFTREGAADVRYEAIIDDPTAFAQQWTQVLVLRRTDARMFEFACHEGNYSLANVLSGARTLEQQKKQQ